MILRNFIKILLLFAISFRSASPNLVNGTNGTTVNFSEWISRSGDRNISNGSVVNADTESCCGFYSRGCSYEYGKLICDCYYGYAQNGKLCEECSCKDTRMECKFEYGIKQCTCPSGYLEVDGKCYDCNCGPNSISCKLNILKDKVCTCKSGYVAKKKFLRGDDACDECNCGPTATSCSFTLLGFRQCTCESGSILEKGFRGVGDQYCRECECGIHSISCKINLYGKKECNCFFGYEMKTGDSECVHYGRNSNGMSDWKIATIITSIIFSIIIIALLIHICSP